MPDRKILVSTLWLMPLLALLALAVAAPIWTSGLITVSTRPDGLRRNFTLSSGQSKARLTAAVDSDTTLEVSALFSENEEQDRADPLDEPQVSFLIPWSFCNVPDRPLVVPRSILSLYPLRC